MPEKLFVSLNYLSLIPEDYYEAVAGAIQAMDYKHVAEAKNIAEMMERGDTWGIMFELVSDQETYILSAPKSEGVFLCRNLQTGEFRDILADEEIRRIF